MNEKIRCRMLTGPTASGKSRLGLQLAEKKGWVIACMDSMQIYRGMDIGTAKPSLEDQARVPHYLLDICDPKEEYSVARWRDQAKTLIHELWEEGQEVLFVGGTGLYMEALIHSMDMGYAEAHPEIRDRLRRIADEPEGPQKLHARLETVDPETAARLPLNDIRRTIRAIEVYEATGIPFSRQERKENASEFDWTIAATRLKREVLYERINRRAGEMVEAGLEQEVRRLMLDGVPENAQSMCGIGYKEMIPVIRGECTLEEATEKIRLNTRHYAKRQETFLRRENQIHYLDADQEDALNELEALFQ